MIRLLYDKVGKYICDTFEDWEQDFDEEEVWCAIAYVLEDYMRDHPGEDPKKIAKRLVIISLGIGERSDLYDRWVRLSKGKL